MNLYKTTYSNHNHYIFLPIFNITPTYFASTIHMILTNEYNNKKSKKLTELRNNQISENKTREIIKIINKLLFYYFKIRQQILYKCSILL